MRRRALLRTLAGSALLPLLAHNVFATATPRTMPSGSGRHPGILLLAHGSNDPQWNQQVLAVATQTDPSLPTEVAFGMATRATMQNAIERLRARGVDDIVAVPLFVSSHSSVIDCTAYLLGLRPDQPPQLAMFASMGHGASHAHATASPDATLPIAIDVPLQMAPALDHHAVVAAILTDRARSISQHAERETVLVVAHGPVSDTDNRLWLTDMQALAASMRSQAHFHHIDYLTLRDDADKPVRGAATQQLRQRVEHAMAAGDEALIVPLLLSYGGIERGLRERLRGLPYRMPAQALLPDARIAQWVLDSTHQQIQRLA